jgi:alcohol dehydrogenase class IV
LNTPKGDINQIAEDAFNVKGLLHNAPRALTLEDITAIYQADF